MREPRVVVLGPVDEPDLRAVALTLQKALGEAADSAVSTPSTPDGEGTPALPATEPESAASPALGDPADVAVVIGSEADARARALGVPHRVVLFPRLSVEWKGLLDADLIVVAHPACVAEAVRRGAPASRVRVAGPIAPEGWAPAPSRPAAREALGMRGDTPVVVVRAAALDPDDLAPTLVQLSLVRGPVAWLFDVGASPELAQALRRSVPGYALDAQMFADGAEALSAYQAASVVYGRLEGPEAVRALAVGAELLVTAPRPGTATFALAVEASGTAEVVDSNATLAVALDGALRRSAEVSDAPDDPPPDDVQRLVGWIQALARGELELGPSGLPVGLERLGEVELQVSEEPVRKPEDDPLEKSVDEELAALRERLGL